MTHSHDETLWRSELRLRFTPAIFRMQIRSFNAWSKLPMRETNEEIKANKYYERGQRWCIWLSHCATRLEVALSIPGRVFGNIQVTSSFCLHSPSVGSTQSVTETKNLPNVKVRMEAQHSIYALSLHDLLWQSFRSTRKEKNIEIYIYINAGMQACMHMQKNSYIVYQECANFPKF
jgi:hypothetical protein